MWVVFQTRVSLGFPQLSGCVLGFPLYRVPEGEPAFDSYPREFGEGEVGPESDAFPWPNCPDLPISLNPGIHLKSY